MLAGDVERFFSGWEKERVSLTTLCGLEKEEVLDNTFGEPGAEGGGKAGG